MENHQVKLIDNTYGKEEAKELLLALINDKIRFLQQRIFSLQERTGCDTKKLENRVKELSEEKHQLLITFENMKDTDCSVVIDCHVNMKIHEHEHLVA